MSGRLPIIAMVLLSFTGTEAFGQSNFESSKLSPGVVTQGAGLQSSKLSPGVVAQGAGLQSSKLSPGVVVENTAFRSSKLSVGIAVEALPGSGIVPHAPLTHW